MEKEERSFWADPFRRHSRAAARLAAGLGGTGPGVTQLGISGLALLAFTAAVKLLSGSWRTAGITFGLGILATACGVLFARHPNVVLLIPALCLMALFGYGVKKVVVWRIGYLAWVASSSEIEQADTGPYSLGQLIKDRFAEAGLTSRLEKALEIMEKKWNSQKQ